MKKVVKGFALSLRNAILVLILSVCAAAAHCQYAVPQNVLIGRTRGKVGNIIFSKWRDKNILKSKPLSINDAKSSTQLLNRGMFSSVVNICKKALENVRIGYRYSNSKLPAYQAAISYNKMTTPVVISDKDYADLSKMKMSDGNMIIPSVGNASSRASRYAAEIQIIVPEMDNEVLPVGNLYVTCMQRNAANPMIMHVCSTVKAIDASGTTTIPIVLTEDFETASLTYNVFYVATNAGIGKDSISRSYTNTIPASV